MPTNYHTSHPDPRPLHFLIFPHANDRDFINKEDPTTIAVVIFTVVIVILAVESETKRDTEVVLLKNIEKHHQTCRKLIAEIIHFEQITQTEK